MGIEAYRSTQDHIEPARAVEYRRLGELIALLLEASLHKDDATMWANAVYQNQQFWSRLRITMLSGNITLPQELRTQLAILAEWVEKESVMAAGGNHPLDDLIAVNQKIMEGLRVTRLS